MTTVDRDTALKAGVHVSPQRDQFVRTGNGIIRVSTAARRDSRSGGIERSDVGLQVADNDDLNVLGMNFLSSLSRWGVEGTMAGSGLLISCCTLHNAYYHT